jgi:hypothetical protein
MWMLDGWYMELMPEPVKGVEARSKPGRRLTARVQPGRFDEGCRSPEGQKNTLMLLKRLSRGQVRAPLAPWLLG